MIRIPLAVDSPLSRTVRISASPLYEMVASLHVLAQTSPPRRYHSWSEEVYRLLADHFLDKDWAYFRPLFRCGIPQVLDHIRSRDVKSEEEQHNYLLSLPTPHFADSVQNLLRRCDSGERGQLAAEVAEDPDYVKGRLLLFLTAYRQICFEATWQMLGPLYLEEEENFQRSTQQLDSLLTYLQQIPANIDFDPQTRSLVCQIPGPYRKAAQLLLSPSYFHFSSPRLDQTGAFVHLLYTMELR